MPSMITRSSTNEGLCTLNQYLAGKDRFRAATRGIPCQAPYRFDNCSQGFPTELEVDNSIMKVLEKYNIAWRRYSVYWKYQVGQYALGKDTWHIQAVGDDPTNYGSAASEIEQVVIAAYTPKKDFCVEICNPERDYNDLSTCIPNDSSLIAAIANVQPKVLNAVRKHIPHVWTSIAYHMRGRRGCKEHEKKPTVIVFCKPKSEMNWSMIERAIVAEVGTKMHSNVKLHLELLPGYVERSTVPFVTHEKDFFLGCHWKLPEKPDNRASIGVVTKDKRLSVGTLGGWVRMQLPDGRSAKCILTTYDVVRDGDLARRILNDHNGIGLQGIQPQSSITVQYPAPLDIQKTKASMEDHKDSIVAKTREILRGLDQLVGKDLGCVVHASGHRTSPASNRVLDWALIDSPSTFKKNVTPVPCPYHPTAAEWLMSLERGEFIQQMGSYELGDKLTSNGRSSISPGYVNRIRRRICWGDCTETEEDEVLGSARWPGPFAERGDVGSWVVNEYGKLVGMIIGLDIWACTAFVTPIKDIVQHIEATTGGKISLP